MDKTLTGTIEKIEFPWVTIDGTTYAAFGHRKAQVGQQVLFKAFKAWVSTQDPEVLHCRIIRCIKVKHEIQNLGRTRPTSATRTDSV